jgi:hypothetical protein
VDSAQEGDSEEATMPARSSAASIERIHFIVRLLQTCPPTSIDFGETDAREKAGIFPGDGAFLKVYFRYFGLQ